MGKFEKKTSKQFLALDQSKQDKLTKKAKKLSKKSAKTDFGVRRPAVVYLGHIPHGFFEPQMRAYFSQFGDIKRLKLSRSKKTGASKGYAFIEFEDIEAAEVVVETMNGYLMFEHILKCQLVPDDKVHPMTFKGSEKYFKKSISQKLSNYEVNRIKSPEEIIQSIEKVEKKNNKLQKKLKELGLEYNFDKVHVSKSLLEENENIGILEKSMNEKTLNSSDYFIIDEDETEITLKIPPVSASKVRYVSRADMNSAPVGKLDLNEDEVEKKEVLKKVKKGKVTKKKKKKPLA